MPLYYFDVTHDEPKVEDTTGLELRDDKAAWTEATRACGEMMRDIDGQLAMGTEWRMEVRDEQGPLFAIAFGAKKLR